MKAAIIEECIDDWQRRCTDITEDSTIDARMDRRGLGVEDGPMIK
jgi:hypothetical protein